MRLPGSRGRTARGVCVATAALAVAAVIGALAAGCVASPSSPPKPVVSTMPVLDGQVSIYNLVVRRNCDDYFHDGQLPRVVYIVRKQAALVDGMPAASPDGAIIPANVQAALLQALADFDPEVKWTDDSADVRGDMTTGGAVDGGRGAIVELGEIAYSSATEATVYASVYVGNLGAAGRTYTLKRVNGVWTITGTTGVEWMS